MRHRKSGKRLGRTWEHRKSLFRNMARSLLTYGRIRTTETKAKELSKVMDRLVTLALRNDLHAKRQAYKVLENHQLVKKLFEEIGPRFAGVKGGFTRVVKLGLPRPGDNAPMAIIEFSRGESEPEPEKKAKKAPAKKGEAKAPAKKAAAKKAAAGEAEAGEEKPKKAPAKKAAKKDDDTSTDKPKTATKKAAAKKDEGEAKATAKKTAAKKAAEAEAPAEEAPAADAPAEEGKDENA